MHQSVRDIFPGFSRDFEGFTTWLYCDNKGLVTIGIGNLVDPIETALGLPFVTMDGLPADRTRLKNAWNAVKARQDLKMHGGGEYRWIPANDVRLPMAEVDILVGHRLDQMDAFLTSRFSCMYLDACADMQLAMLSLSWACGPNFHYPKMIAHLNAGDLVAAAEEIAISPAIGTIVHRNTANRTLLRNASEVVRRELDPEVLNWPLALLQ